MLDMALILAAFGLGAGGAWLIKEYGCRLGLEDISNERSSHSGCTPKGGGSGILVAFLLSALLLNVPYTLWGPAVVLSFVSLWGDRNELSPRTRIVIQFGSSMIFLVGIFCFDEGHPGGHNLAWFLFLAVFVVGTANFYNFMDGINGMSGIAGVVAFLLLAVHGYITGADFKYVNLCVAISFSCLGFLIFNVPVAKVFMGDAGSILMGFVFACMVVILTESAPDFIRMAGFLFLFYADELTTMYIRLKDGESLIRPHRRHVYQLLANEYGIPHWKVSLIYGIVQSAIGGLLLMAKDNGTSIVVLILTGCFVCFWGVSNRIRSKLGFI